MAIPKQDKLKTPVTQFLKSKDFILEGEAETGILFDARGDLPNIRIEFVRAADALLLMNRKVVDLGIIGSDTVAENADGPSARYERPQARLDLGIAQCAFQLAVPTADRKQFSKPSDINGLRIATSYPNLLGKWLANNNITPAEIVVREGGVESSIRMGLADVVADLVDTGSTLRRNKLTPVFDIATTSAVCYSRPAPDIVTEMLVGEFLRRLRPVRIGQGEQRPNYAIA